MQIRAIGRRQAGTASLTPRLDLANGWTQIVVEGIDRSPPSEHHEWELTELVEVAPGQYTDIRTLRGVFRALQQANGSEHWKDPIALWMHHSAVNVAVAAIRYFHGGEVRVGPSRELDGHVLVANDGYTCW